MDRVTAAEPEAAAPDARVADAARRRGTIEAILGPRSVAVIGASRARHDRLGHVERLGLRPRATRQGSTSRCWPPTSRSRAAAA